MQWKIFMLILLAYVAASERTQIEARFNPNHEKEYRKSVEIERERLALLPQSGCSPCAYYLEQVPHQHISTDGKHFTLLSPRSLLALIYGFNDFKQVGHVSPQQGWSTKTNTQGGNGAAGENDGAHGATPTATHRVTPASTNRDRPTAINRDTPTGANRDSNAAANRGNNAADKTATTTIPPPQSDNPIYKFHQKLFKEVAPINSQRNLIYSPMSLNTLLAMVYIGANQNTAAELQRTLELPANRDQCAKEFQQTLNTEHIGGDAQLLMANKMYYNRALQLKSEVNRFAQSYFNAELEPINFAKTTAAADKINKWVAERTQQHIQNLIAPNSLDTRTSAILLNAIYFKAKWAKEFSTSDTQKGDFFVNPEYKVPVDMMFTDDVFQFAELDDVQAVALDLPYKDTDLSMLVVLPLKNNGLRAVEERLSNMDLSAVLARMKPESITVRLPKFSIEYEQDMVQPLIRTGINDLFTSYANLTSFFQGPDQPLISKVQHKAFINVNEAGSEAAAASFAKFIPLSLPAKQYYFTADHPFMFIIHSPQAVYFAGHVVNF